MGRARCRPLLIRRGGTLRSRSLLGVLLLLPALIAAEVEFGGLDLTPDNRLLFRATVDLPDYGTYSTLFLADAGERKLSQLTFFPEKALVLNGELQVQNRFGVFRTRDGLKSMAPVDLFPFVRVGRPGRDGQAPAYRVVARRPVPRLRPADVGGVRRPAPLRYRQVGRDGPCEGNGALPRPAALALVARLRVAGLRVERQPVLLLHRAAPGGTRRRRELPAHRAGPHRKRPVGLRGDAHLRERRSRVPDQERRVLHQEPLLRDPEHGRDRGEDPLHLRPQFRQLLGLARTAGRSSSTRADATSFSTSSRQTTTRGARPARCPTCTCRATRASGASRGPPTT